MRFVLFLIQNTDKKYLKQYKDMFVPNFLSDFTDFIAKNVAAIKAAIL